MRPLISIIGPTATGKTKFALEVARELLNQQSQQKFSQQFSYIDLISIDSRQVYKKMEIGTGVDLPPEFERAKSAEMRWPFYIFDKVRLHGISIVKPDEEWSVADCQRLVQEVMEKSWQQNSLPILVGGTGFYQFHLGTTAKPEYAEMKVPPNEEVRERAASMSVYELQEWAEKTAPQKYALFNNSDQNNPRRLVRVIEIGLMNRQSLKSLSFQRKLESSIATPSKTLAIGLTNTIENIAPKIAVRVQERLDNGMQEEVQKLMVDYSDQIWHDAHAFSATGYKEVRAFLEDKMSKEEMIELWTRREVQYAKRQLTWFKKYAKDATWFDVQKTDWQKEAINQIKAWLANNDQLYSNQVANS